MLEKFIVNFYVKNTLLSMSIFAFNLSIKYSLQMMHILNLEDFQSRSMIYITIKATYIDYI